MMNESREFEVELELKARVTMQDIDDIMCTALDGGITGWCRAAKPVGKRLGEYAHEQIARGGSLMLYDAESSRQVGADAGQVLTRIGPSDRGRGACGY